MPDAITDHAELPSRPIPRLEFNNALDLGTHLTGQTRPFIATGAAVARPESAQWTPERFAHHYAEMPVSAHIDLPLEGTPYALDRKAHLRRMSMAEFVGRLADTQGVSYLHQIPLKLFADLPSTFNFDAVLPPNSGRPAMYLWLGSCGTRSGLHFDRFDNINVQIYGRKHVYLVAPEQSSCLYPFGDNVEKSQVDPDHPGLAQFPRFADVRPFTAIMEPGEMLFIPRLWWHHIRSLEPAINVNCWFGEHVSLRSILSVVRQGGVSCWAQVAKDFVVCGMLGRDFKTRLFSDPPTGKFLYDLVEDSVKRRLTWSKQAPG